MANLTLTRRSIPLLILLPVVLTGCGMLNTAGSNEFACPGMPGGVLCKTPAAVYKTTNAEILETEFDTPVGSAGKVNPVESSQSIAPSFSGSVVNGIKTEQTRPAAKLITVDPGPKPVREPAQVVRIWIAPWIDKQDNLHLAQIQYSEIKPRTWTLGKAESVSASGYSIPHLAFNSIDKIPEASKVEPSDAKTNVRPEKRSSDPDNKGPVNSQTHQP